MKTYADQVRKISCMLTEENWNKGSYFAVKNDKLCMCVHGAGQTLVNPQVKEALEITTTTTTTTVVKVAAVAREEWAADAKSAANVAKDRNSKLFYHIWSNRKYYIRNDYVFNEKNYGNTNLHYLMGMFGIDVTFNDNENTTLYMLKDKLKECADWAEQNEEFLQNN